MTETLTQCKMHRRHPATPAIAVDVAWIDTDLAKKGTVIKFRDLEGLYEVVEVWSTKPKQEVEAFERIYLHQREASDTERNPNRGRHMEF